MCGIAYFENKIAPKGVARSVKKRFQKQRNRGTQGFGFVSYDLKTARLDQYAQFTTEADALKALEAVTTNAVLFHHRYPTSTPNVAEASHPILVKNKRLDATYYVVHNGIISNADTLKPAHEKLGYKYVTEIQKINTLKTRKTTITEKNEIVFNDSEALAIELAEVIEGRKEECDARGSMAFIALQVKKGKVINMFFGRNDSNPLKSDGNISFFSLTSEGGGKEVPVNKLFRRDPLTGEVFERPLEFKPRYVAPTTTKDDKQGDFYATHDWDKETRTWLPRKDDKRTVINAELDKRCWLCDTDADKALGSGRYCKFHYKTMGAKPPKKCDYCDKPADGTLGGGLLCKDHYKALGLDEFEDRHEARELKEEDSIRQTALQLLGERAGVKVTTEMPLSQFATERRLKDFRNEDNILAWSNLELVEGGYAPDDIIGWLDDTEADLKEIKLNATLLKDFDELADTIELLAEVEDRRAELMKALEMEDAVTADDEDDMSGTMMGFRT